MAAENKFGRMSELRLETEYREGQTILSDVFFTAPFKVMQPFRISDDLIQVMALTASAGIMEGDLQKLDIHVKEGSKLEYLSQAYEKIHRMKEGQAKRNTTLRVEKNAFLKYAPLPTIPFKDSAFENHMEVELADDSAKLLFQEILSAGRVACGEAFAYRFFHNRVAVRKEGKLIYLDNSRYEPEMFDMSGCGMYEGYTHLLNLVFFNMGKSSQWAGQVRELLEEETEMQGAVSRISSGDYMVRILGKGSEPLLNISKKIQALE